MRDPADRASDQEQRQRAPLGQPERRHRRAEREIDIRMLAGELRRGGCGGGDAGAGRRPRPGDRLDDRAGARIAVRIQRMAESRQIVAARQPRRHDRHRIGAVADLVEQRLGARRLAAVPPPGQRAERRRDDRIRRRAGRGDNAGDKSRRVQLVVGQQHQNAADQIGARLVQTPGRGELADAPDRRRARHARRRRNAATSSARIVRPVRMIPARLRSSAARSSAASIAIAT